MSVGLPLSLSLVVGLTASPSPRYLFALAGNNCTSALVVVGVVIIVSTFRKILHRDVGIRSKQTQAGLASVVSCPERFNPEQMYPAVQQVYREYAVTPVGGESGDDAGEILLDVTFGSQSVRCSSDNADLASCDYSFSACQLVRLEGVWYRVKASFEPDGSGQVTKNRAS